MKCILPVFILTVGCGSPDEAERGSMVQDADLRSVPQQGHCVSYGEQRRVLQCIDYENLTSQDYQLSKDACSSSADSSAQTSLFVDNKLCPQSDRLGGCSFAENDGVVLTSWVYSSGDVAIDKSLIDLAKQRCRSQRSATAQIGWVDHSGAVLDD